MAWGKMHQNPSPFSNDEREFQIFMFKFQMAVIFRIEKNGHVEHKDVIFFKLGNGKWGRSRQSRSGASLDEGAGVVV